MEIGDHGVLMVNVSKRERELVTVRSPRMEVYPVVVALQKRVLVVLRQLQVDKNICPMNIIRCLIL